MRSDSLGMFWRDEPPLPKIKKGSIKKVAPDPVWLRDDYLPHLNEALEFNVHIMSDEEIITAACNNEPLVFDVECYLNYFICSFKSTVTDKIIFFELADTIFFDKNKLIWVLQNFLIVGFNSLSYDLPIIFLAVAGKSNAILKRATEMIIVEGMRGEDILKQFKVKKIKDINHIDLINVAPLQASLKIYGGRLHTPRMQDLPFNPDLSLSNEQITIIRWYNINSDLTATKYLYTCLEAELSLRESLSKDIGIDLRSKSDPQIAEAIIAHNIFKKTGAKPKKIEIPPGTVYKYKAPNFVKFESNLMKWALNQIENSDFIVEFSGSIGKPESIKNLKLQVNKTTYQMGIGGLHSCESTISHISDADHILIDKDVSSNYPYIILISRLYPAHIGPVFLLVYKEIVDTRMAAKKGAAELKRIIKLGLSANLDFDKKRLKELEVATEGLKIAINGSFGKLASMYSFLYSPDLLIQVTLTGQLILLMLIERLELAGIPVVSANTDGIVIKCPTKLENLCSNIVSQWEHDTGFQTEETRYKALYSRDVNNYIALKEDGSTKLKGAYSNPWGESGITARCLHKNPVNIICIEAVEKFLISRTPIHETICNEKDIRKFVNVRTAKGGAVKDGQFLGKAIRWYYSKNAEGEIIYAKNGNKIPRSEGAMPLMDLPEQLPKDVDYDWYINESQTILKNIGFTS